MTYADNFYTNKSAEIMDKLDEMEGVENPNFTKTFDQLMDEAKDEEINRLNKKIKLFDQLLKIHS